MHSIVVLAYPGTEEKMAQIWNRFCASAPLVTTCPDTPLPKILEDIMADGEVEQNFVLVPANLMPVHQVNGELLRLPFVYIDGHGERNYWGLVPVSFDKERLVDFLPANDSLSGNDFVAKYLGDQSVRPVEVSFHFGNFVTPAFRGTPCENVIIEAFIRKHFVYSSPAAWPVMSRLVDRLI